MSVQETRRDTFFSKKNEGVLEKVLVKDFNRRLGSELTEQQENALNKRVKYYMGKVYEDTEYSSAPIQTLNTAVLKAVVPDYLSYLKRPTRPDEAGMEKIRNDVSSRFDSMQQERQGDRSLPAPPNFQMTLDDNYPPTLGRLEELKKQREAEATRFEEVTPQLVQNEISRRQGTDDLERRINSDDMFRSSSKTYAENDAMALALRDSARNSRVETNQIDILPDPRRSFFGENETATFGTRSKGLANANPTLILPEGVSTRTPLPQDIIKPQSDIVSYRDNEYNLFVYSADRDWVNNTAQNRYNFTVNFDPANNKIGYGLSPSTYIKFKNIVRIELVKVIMPTEGIETLSTKIVNEILPATTPATYTQAYNTNNNINVFSYPYLQVRVDELNTNGYGTNDGLNNSFGVISYDAYWASDTSLKNRGFTRLVPKFLKCQKVYYPTPLATLQRLTIQIQKPDSTPLSTSADALDVVGFIPSPFIIEGNNPEPTNTIYYDSSGEYLWFNTKTWFSQFNFTQGDRVVFNLAFASSIPITPASIEFLDFINNPQGHIIVDIAYKLTQGSFAYRVGSNKLGYSNYIIIRSKFNDPTTGSTNIAPFGGTMDTYGEFVLSILTSQVNQFSSFRVLNLSHQIQVVFRVITRDMDSATRLRPDNL